MAQDIAWMGAAELVSRVHAGEVDLQAATECHLDRISRLDPQLGAFVYVDRSAAAGTGPLAGVTVAVKDSYPVAGMPWTDGSPRWRDRVAADDALPVARLRAAGAAVVGKTNLPELAAAVGTVNELFPPTHNPWRRGFTPGGSSGGSAAAVAAGLCTIALGDDMGGSIRIPAACCGVAGLRPSPGRVPSELPDPTRLSVRGPLGRQVSDLRAALSLMADSLPAPRRPRSQAPLRVAHLERSPVPVEPRCRLACERAAAALESAGHRLSPASWDPEPLARSYQLVRPGSVSIMPGEPEEYGAAAARLIARGRELSGRQLLEALAAGLAGARWLNQLLAEHDAVLTPTLGRLPMPIAEVPAFLSEEWLSYTQFVLPVSYAGLPAVSVPAGLHDGRPVGVQLIGRFAMEQELLDLAEQLESSAGFGFQRPPGFE
jgi:amidase